MSRKRAFELAEKLGATIHDEGTSFGLEAPKGMRIQRGLHELVYDCEDGIKNPFTGRTVWQEIIEDLKQDLFETCTDTACEWCNN